MRNEEKDTQKYASIVEISQLNAIVVLSVCRNSFPMAIYPESDRVAWLL